MGAGESKNKIVDDEVLVVDDKEVDNEEMIHHLRREIEELRVENRKLKNEVEEINAERVRLRREQTERVDKYSKLKIKMQQQQKDHANQMDWQQFMIRIMQAQLEAIQGEPLQREYEGMNHYLLYNQTFIVVHGSVVVQSFRLMSIWFSIVNQVHIYLAVSNSDMFSCYKTTVCN